MSEQATVQVKDAASLGRAIRRRRKSLGLRQEDVATQTGISRATLLAIENGKDTAQIGLVLQLCRDLGLEVLVGSRLGNA